MTSESSDILSSIEYEESVEEENEEEKKNDFYFIINEMSGGKDSKEMYTIFGSLFDASHYIPINQLRDDSIPEKNKENIIVVICGGDGTVSSSIRCLGNKFTYFILPFGTGNDLCHSLHFVPEDVLRRFHQQPIEFITSTIVSFPKQRVDQWKVSLATYPSSFHSFTTFQTFTNYFSIGIDAAIALSFSKNREKGMSTPFINKCRYAMSASSALNDWCQEIHNKIILEVDGKIITLPQMDCLMFVSSTTCYGGRRLWRPEHSSSKNNKSFGEHHMDDGIIEIMYIRNIVELASVALGFSTPIPLMQGKDIIITIKPSVTLPIQIDGEPSEHSQTVFHLSSPSSCLFLSSF